MDWLKWLTYIDRPCVFVVWVISVLIAQYGKTDRVRYIQYPFGDKVRGLDKWSVTLDIPDITRDTPHFAMMGVALFK